MGETGEKRISELPLWSWLWSDPRQFVLLQALRRAGGPVYAAELARQFHANPDTVSDKLHSLEVVGLVRRRRVQQGWLLTGKGLLYVQSVEMLSGAADEEHKTEEVTEALFFVETYCMGRDGRESRRDADFTGWEDGSQADQAEGRADGWETRENQGANLAGEEQVESTDFHGWAAGIPLEETGGGEAGQHEGANLAGEEQAEAADFHGWTAVFPATGPGEGGATGGNGRKNPRQVEKKNLEESLINIDSSSEDSDSVADMENSMHRLLAKSALLFGPPGVLSKALPQRPVQLVLGWLAQAYAQRQALHNPAGLVYKRLLSGEKPNRCYLEHPEKYLPGEYLAAVGLARYGRTAEEEDEEQAMTEEEGGVDASLLQEVNGRTAQEAWAQVVRLLRGEMRLDVFQRYVEATKAVAWQEEAGVLVVGVESEAVRAWLEARAAKIVERMLVGILNREVAVRFLVVDG